MAPPQVFVIEVQNGNRAFFPGQPINGRVILHCQEQKKLRGIYLTLVGRAYVHWTERHTSGTGDNQQTTTVHYRAEEPYFNFRVNLWGGEGEQQLPPGNYEWPFSFQLPSVALPTSYEGYYGNIRYWLEARMDRPWKFDHVTKFAFTVLERVDLNLSQEDLNAPRRGEGQKTLGCLCCQSGPLTLAVSTDRGAYCAGEKILLNARLENNTNKEMRMLKATLGRTVAMYARGKCRHHQDVVAEMKTTGGIPAGQIFEWNQEPLPIPACPPSSHTCRIIHTDYSLDVEVVVPTFSFNLHVVLPIVIGTEPLRSAYTNTALPTVGFTNVEAVNIADDQYTMGQTQFAPMYSMVQMPPVGQFESQPPPASQELPQGTQVSDPVYPPNSQDQKVDLAPPYPG